MTIPGKGALATLAGILLLAVSLTGLAVDVLSFRVEPQLSFGTAFEGLPILLVLKNISEDPVVVNGRLLVSDESAPPEAREVTVSLIGSDRSEVPFRSLVNAGAPARADFVTLQPGEEVTRLYDLDEAFSSSTLVEDTYAIRAIYDNPVSGAEFGLDAWTGRLEAAEVYMTIAPPILQPSTAFIVFNPTLPPVDDVHVRRALAYALDRGQYEAYWEGIDLATTVTPISLWPMDRGALPEGLAFDPNKASTELFEAGYSDELASLQLLSSSGWAGVAEVARDSWAQHLDIEVELLVVPSEEYLDRLNNGRIPHMYVGGWRGDYASPYNFLGDVFHTSAPYNRTMISSRTFDDLIREAALADAEDESYQLFLEAERLLVEVEAFVIPLYHYW